MSVDECIKVYEDFMKQIFPEERPSQVGFPWEYDASKFENVLKKVIEERCNNPDELLLDEFSEPRVY
jgi:hypothetical protein